jgi:site-specific DNA recombinase
MNRALIYARVSTEDQVEKYGLPTQLRACREHAGKLGLQIVAEISDEGVSGAIIDRRGLERARQMVRNGDVDVILMLDVDRLSRELSHLLILKPEIEKHARLEFVTANFEDSPSGRMFFGIRGVIAQYERELTRERTMRGKKERARSGLIVGGRVPYGYLYEGGALKEDPERAGIARRIFSDYVAGASIRSIAVALRQAGAPTYAGGKWGRSSVHRVLRNETYAGTAHYGTHQRQGKLVKLRPSGDRISIAVPALIDRAIWERTQVRLNANPFTGRPTQNYLLRGLLHCAKCQRRMIGENSKKSRCYRCSGRDRTRHQGDKCVNHVSMPLIDNAVWGAICKAFSDPESLARAIRQQENELRAADPGSIEDLRKSLARVKRKEELALAAMLDPDLAAGRAKVKESYRAACEDRVRLEAQVAAVERSCRSERVTNSWVAETTRLIVREMREMSDQTVKQEFLRTVLRRAEWNGEEIRMVCFISPELSTTSARYGRPRRRRVTRAAPSSGHGHRGNPVQ